jgi:hypothetical protein
MGTRQNPNFIPDKKYTINDMTAMATMTIATCRLGRSRMLRFLISKKTIGVASMEKSAKSTDLA